MMLGPVNGQQFAGERAACARIDIVLAMAGVPLS